MLAQDPLNLQCVQLKAAQEWTHQGEQLSFIFPKAGAGKWVAGAVVQRLGPGDVLVLNATVGGKLCAAGPGELVFWCISLQLEHLFPLFESSEICLLQNISDGFKTAKLYPAAIPVAQESHRRLAKMPAQVNLDHRCHLLQVVAGILTVEFNRAKSQRIGFVRPEEHMAQVFEKLTAGRTAGFIRWRTGGQVRLQPAPSQPPVSSLLWNLGRRPENGNAPVKIGHLVEGS